VRLRPVLAVLAATCAAALAASSAFATVSLPKPGSASQVSALVAASSQIQQLPRNLLPPLGQAAQDSPGAYYSVASRLCVGVTKCVFGDRKSKTTVVLFGDSHAQMWLPALVPVAASAGDRLVLVWMPGCPDTTITVWSIQTHSGSRACDNFRASSIAAIRSLAPKVVLLADRTSDIPDAHNKLTANAAWQAGLEQTIAKLKSPKTAVAVIGDVTAFTTALPECLAANPRAVQSCSVPNPNPRTHQHFAAEAAAAAAEGVPYVNPQPWLCTKVCSPVIGNMVAYFDKLHVAATYAEYLSAVMAAALKGIVGP